jgi:multiple sugar transport system permease protein
MSRSTRRTLYWIFHYALIALYLVVALFPLFWIFKVSVTPNDILYTEGVRLWPSRFNFDHYVDVIKHTDFPRFFINSVIVAGSTAVLTTLISAGAGYSFSRFIYRGKFWLVGLMLVTQMFPLVMIIAPIFKLFAPLGLNNSLLGLIIIYTTYNVPFAAFLMQSFFDGVPKDLEEAAMIDGATRFGAVVKIVLPLTMPGIAATLGFVFTAAWSELLFALMLNNKESEFTFPVGLLSFVTKFAVDFGQMMAAGILALIPVCIFFLMIQRYLVKGLMAGAVKG